MKKVTLENVMCWLADYVATPLGVCSVALTIGAQTGWKLPRQETFPTRVVEVGNYPKITLYGQDRNRDGKIDLIVSSSAMPCGRGAISFHHEYPKDSKGFRDYLGYFN